MTPHEIALRVLKQEHQQLKRFYNELLVEKNVLQTELEIIAKRFKMTQGELKVLRREAGGGVSDE